jgi:50S ribosomal subunit-associated GTPase HflX
VHISAARGVHLDRLLAAVDTKLLEDPVQHARLRIPQSAGKALALVEARSVIRARNYVADGPGSEAVEFEVDAAQSLLRQLRDFVL